jgi:CDP-diacylglycerol--glycerol-3-phosphate 3-phosphatidyltransferase
MGDQSFVSTDTRQRIRGLALPIALGLGRLGLTPNGLTIVGFVGTCLAAVAAGAQLWLASGLLVLVFGIFDMFDGALARATGRATPFGAFLDSTLDRTGENLVLVGVAVGCAAAGFPLGTALAALAMAFASVVTYARARAEGLGLHGEVGVAPRPERLLVLATGLILAGIPVGLAGFGQASLGIALGLIAALSAVTVLQRIVHVRRQLDQPSKETR